MIDALFADCVIADVASPAELIDEVVDVVTAPDGAIWATARKRVRRDDPYMSGHFPDRTIFPGVFVIECVRQLVCRAASGGAAAADIEVIRFVRFFAPLLEGDVADVQATIDPADPAGQIEVEATVTKAGVLAAKLRMSLSIGVGVDD